ncbi:MAG: DUF748 domain-containing protein [Chlorobiales bacterium]|nr:DUF748 domain-containing protein [Chlorobiales bacterium]
MLCSDRITNIQHILGKTDSLSRPDSLAVADTTKKSAAPTMATRIGNVRVIDGSMNFSDLSLTPNFAVGIHYLNGSIKGLSSQQLTRADVDLTGKVDKYAPATIRGQINPLSENAFTDILLSFKSIELTTFTPYSGKFAGYKIDKGKLSLDLHYVLSQSMLVGENKIILDQLTLGESVESPDATSLPLRLAVALLKDSRGVIDIDLPIRGNINDPQFSVMPIVFKALLNLLVKIVTSPFRLLGALFGGGEEMQYVGFVPGTDSIPAPERTKLDSLANALTQRPELKLDVRGAVAFAADREALATRMINPQIHPEGGQISPAQLTKAQRERLLKLYTTTFKEDPSVLVPEKDDAGNTLSKDQRQQMVTEAAYHQLVTNYPVSENELRSLAQKRAAAIKDRLVTAGKIDEVRIFLQDVDLKADVNSGQVKTQLSLDAR